MYSLKTLENTDPLEIFQAFKASFANYHLPMDFTPELHLSRWRQAGVDLKLSYAAFYQGQVCAFALMVPLADELFNLASGVIPSQRGHGLLVKLFQRLIPEIQHLGYKKISLEVIEENEIAQAVYRSAGFKTVRRLHSLKGEILIPEFGGNNKIHYQIRDFDSLPKLADGEKFSPSFEQRAPILLNQKNSLEIHELKDATSLLAYCVFRPQHMNLVELAGVNTESLCRLLGEMRLAGEQVGIINVDERNSTLLEFLKSLGLAIFLTHHQMELSL